MTRTLLFFLLIAPLSVICQHNIEYPKPWKSDTSDTYFGTKVADPYRWLEDINSPKTLDWVTKESTLTDQFVSGKKILLNEIYDKLLEYRWSDSKRLDKRGMYYFRYYIYDEEKPTALLYRKSYNGNETVIVDPEDYKEKKTELLSIKDYSVSGDGRHLAFSLSKSGSDWVTIRVVDLENKKPTSDVVEHVKIGNMSWKGNGFFYIKYNSAAENSRITEPVSGSQLFYHKLGDHQNQDMLVYNPYIELHDNWFSYAVTSDEKYLILYCYFQNPKTEVKRGVLYATLDSFPSIHPRPFILDPVSSKNSYEVINNIGDSFLVKTTMNAPTGKVLIYKPAEGINQYKEVIPQYLNVLEYVGYANNEIICSYYLKGRYMVCIYDMSGKMIKQVQFPIGNSVHGLNVSPDDKEAYCYVNSFYYPSIAYRLDLQTLKTGLVTNTKIGFDPKEFETKYVSFQSIDSTEIPMFLTYKKGLNLKKNNPVLLFGYGGFGVSLTPFFDPSTVLWIENGGVFAVPTIRGGGEKGDIWHEEGKRLKKINSFNDFISAAKFLIDSNFTSPEKLAIEGGSNGGLLVGVAMTQHPELFKAVIAEMGVFDMLRYDKFSLGTLFTSEYGLSSNSKDFQNLLSYSPLHNLKNGVNYPATLVITGDNDDRVPPLHSYKFIATLQEFGDKSNPYFLKVLNKSGHYGSSLLKDRLENDALKCLFLFKNLKMDLTTVY